MVLVQFRDEPRLRWRWRSAFASKDWPVRNMHPQPESEVQPFSPLPTHAHTFEGGLLGWKVSTGCSLVKSHKRTSLIGVKWDRYVSQIREVKSA